MTSTSRTEVTDGMPYDKVTAELGTEIERYECPAAVVARHLRSLERGVLTALQHAQLPANSEAVRRKKRSLEPVKKGVRLTVCSDRRGGADGTSAGPSAKVAPAPIGPCGMGTLAPTQAHSRVRVSPP